MKKNVFLILFLFLTFAANAKVCVETFMRHQGSKNYRMEVVGWSQPGNGPCKYSSDYLSYGIMIHVLHIGGRTHVIKDEGIWGYR